MKVTLKHPVVKVLISRDGLSLEEAIQRVEEGICYMSKADTLSQAESILMEDFGLEPDYLFSMLGV